ncbi:unnamed protein product [Hermetia illucens]|uniref:Cytochrome P450 n=2 Tax=Hermetia illucens TaxID=343691 RepID=A0A7R8UHF7_HERIL|nr:unnamed protein product [Hermetia illucens]
MGFLSTDGSQPENIKLLAGAVKQLFISQRDSYYGFGLWKYLPTKTYRDFTASEEIIYNVVSDIIDNTASDDDASCDDDLKCVFLEILKNDQLDIREKKSAIIDFIAAGIETLANTLIFNLHYIIKDPFCLSRIREEFQNSSELIYQDDLSKATYTKACIQEVYRLQPTAFCLARLLEEETTLSDYNLKAGTIVICHSMLACRKEENFKDAKKFKPERWIQNNNLHVNTESGSGIVIPFGSGKRTCPGKRFVNLELILLVAKLCKTFDITFMNEMEIDCEFLLVAKPPVNLILKDI